jgi:hypothetical protein
MHQLLFTDLQKFVVPVTPLSGKNVPADQFALPTDNVGKQRALEKVGLKMAGRPHKSNDIWLFAVVADIGTDGSMYYQVFRIDWAEVKNNIEEGMTMAVSQLVSELPASPDSSRNSAREPILPGSIRSQSLDSPDSRSRESEKVKGNSNSSGTRGQGQRRPSNELPGSNSRDSARQPGKPDSSRSSAREQGGRGSAISNTKLEDFRNRVANLSDYGKDTVDAEALFVRVAYMARRIRGQADADAIKDVLASLGSSPSVKDVLEYVCPPIDPRVKRRPEEQILMRRKP